VPDRPEIRIVAAIPAYNEQRYIGSVVLAARKHVSEVIVLDDGSTDGTAEIARMAGATVFASERNLGKGAVMRDLLTRMKDRPPDVLVFLDGDGQHDPNEIPFATAATWWSGPERPAVARPHSTGRSGKEFFPSELAWCPGAERSWIPRVAFARYHPE
jgi:glycosyltransferase involved in cell wall biosynthesis